MTVVTTKSPSIINWDASPIFIPTIGEGAEGPLRVVSDFITENVGDSIGSVYRIIRVPTNAKIKQLLLNVPTASTAGAADIDIAFSDSTTDGTQPSLQSGVVQLTGPVDNKLFAAAFALTSARNNVDITFAGGATTGGTFTQAHQNIPLWQVLVSLGATQFVADPGGFFDIVAKLTTALTVTAGTFGLTCYFVE